MIVPAYDDRRCLQRYHALRQEQPGLFVNPVGCPTEILVTAAEIREAQAAVAVERRTAGMATVDLRVGVLAEDPFIGHVIRDAVRFSDGRYGLYNRVVVGGGVLVLPILVGAVALVHIFRHASRRWFYEAPQGLVSRGADAVDDARRELIEETGAYPTEMIPLGTVHTSPPLATEALHVFAARIAAPGAPQRSEGIDRIRIVPNGEIDKLVLDGTICDGSTTTALMRARIRGLL